MPPRAWKVLSAVIATSVPWTANAANYRELEAMVSGPWHHLPAPVGALQFNRDDAKCRVIAAQTPVDSTTPAIVEMVRWTTEINCLKSLGYEPGPEPKRAAKSIPDTTFTASKITLATCLNFSDLRKLPGDAATLIDLTFFSWTEGYITAWNITMKDPVLKIDPDAIPLNNQQKFLQSYCAENPSKYYVEAVTALMAKLKYEKTKATGHAEEP